MTHVCLGVDNLKYLIEYLKYYSYKYEVIEGYFINL